MSFQLTWTAIAVIMAILGHGAFTVWYASQMSSKLDIVHNCLDKMEKEFEKRDNKIDAAFRKLDSQEHRLTVVETKCTSSH